MITHLADLAGKHSSQMHICAIEYWQLVTTCIYTNLSQINIINRIFLYYRSLPCVTYINCGPKRDSNHRRQMTLLKKQTLYQPSHHGWLNLDNLFPLISCGNNLNKSKLGIIFYCNKKSFSLDIHFNTLKHKRI